MNHEDFDALVGRYLDRVASEDEVTALSRRLRENAAERQRYLDLAQMHAELVSGFEAQAARAAAVSPARPAPRRVRHRFALAWAAAIALVGTVAALLAVRRAGDRAVAGFVALQDCRWVDPGVSVRPGDPIRSGQRLELSSGTVELRFARGAVATLFGPAIFEVSSGNEGFLTLGQIKVKADTPESKGFTVRTRTARVVDVGTAFVAAAAPDGQSRVDVTEGEVQVHVAGGRAPHRLRTGQALAVEAGNAQVLVRIEPGDGTAAFRFPTIEPPSSSDFADATRGAATIRVVRGALRTNVPIPSGPPELLLDGRGQSRPDSPAESVFFDDNASGALLLDLGRSLAITRINTYSWHQNRDSDVRVRAVQRFTLYGFAGDRAPATDDPLTEAGWELLARVNSDDLFRVVQAADRPAQQACSISGTRGSIGRYRYLLWEVQPTLGHNLRSLNNTFYSEIDVYGTP